MKMQNKQGQRKVQNVGVCVCVCVKYSMNDYAYMHHDYVKHRPTKSYNKTVFIVYLSLFQ